MSTVHDNFLHQEIQPIQSHEQETGPYAKVAMSAAKKPPASGQWCSDVTAFPSALGAAFADEDLAWLSLHHLPNLFVCGQIGAAGSQDARAAG